MLRRHFIKNITLTALASALPRYSYGLPHIENGDLDLRPAVALPAQRQTWLGADLWANRLQDWQVNDGRIECLEGGENLEVRTVSLLTRELKSTQAAGRLRIKLGMLNPGKQGFGGFLLGVGAGELDYRGAAIAQRVGGENGGFMAVVDERGRLSFRDFSEEGKQLKYEKLNFTAADGQTLLSQSPKSANWELDCIIKPIAGGQYDLTLSLYDANTGQRLNSIVQSAVPAHYVQGGIMLLSSSDVGHNGARWWFSDIRTAGEKVRLAPERQVGPVLGCMHSLDATKPSAAVLKMTAQLFPLSLSKQDRLVLEVFDDKQQQWQRRDQQPLQDGYVALFKVTALDARQAWPYRVRLKGQAEVLFDGEIQAGVKTEKPLSIALFSCLLSTANSIDRVGYEKLIPQEQNIGRYTRDNILFPHAEMVENCERNAPDLYMFCGDQYYEHYPTRSARGTRYEKVDTLYRWYLWLWTFRDVLRNKPCILLADDHDILQGNVWGNAGVDAVDDKEESGGFKWSKSLVRMVYRVQHGHNPDSYEDLQIEHGIPVSYGSFVYRGTDISFVEDRKFKTPPDYEADPLTVKGELLGAKQEAFLAQWATTNTDLPKVCLTASMWGSPQTGAQGEPLLDYDANGYPPDGRTRAVELVSKANALVLAGDQHLGLVAHQGLNDFDDGALFFAGPAGAAFWQRWFEGAGKLNNKRNDDPNTGDFVDTFGNKMRVLAVANPKITHAEFDKSNQRWGKFVGDHRLKSEGYGIVRVNQERGEFELECWPAKANPEVDAQFSGWPVIQPIPQLKKRFEGAI